MKEESNPSNTVQLREYFGERRKDMAMYIQEKHHKPGEKLNTQEKQVMVSQETGGKGIKKRSGEGGSKLIWVRCFPLSNEE